VRLDGSAHEIDFPEGLNGDEAVVLIPAPLPIHWLKSFVFRSKEEKVDFEARAMDYGNVPWSNIGRAVQARSLGKPGPMFVWPPEDLRLEDRDDSLDLVMAAGGMLAMMFLMGNRGEPSVNACRFAFDREEELATKIGDPLLKGLGPWLTSGSIPDTTEIPQTLFWGVVERIARCRSERETTPRDAVLDFLEDRKASMEESYRTRLTDLIDDLRGLAGGFSGSTVSELFQRHPKPLSRALMLLFLRDKCYDLLDFKHESLVETDYLAAALLFGARDGWLGVPLQLRDHPGLSAAVSHRMAAMAHRVSGSRIDLGEPPPRCQPLRELFSPGPRGLSDGQRQAAAYLTRQLEWGCIHTRISLGRGEYRMVIDSRGTHLLLPGEVRAVTVEPDMAEFFRKLAEARLDGQLERKVREILKG
jgi:hypothetical protein